jgi:hypothetical protein
MSLKTSSAWSINRKLPRMMAGPIAFTLAKAIDEQLANAGGADRGDD